LRNVDDPEEENEPRRLGVLLRADGRPLSVAAAAAAALFAPAVAAS
jgi:hypothetical protein